MATVYEIITDRVVSAIESGNVLPWRKTWRASGGLPRNLTSGKMYRGINVFLLAMLGYKNPFFLTFNQCKGLKGKVTKGSKGCPVIFWKWPTPEDKQRAEAEGKTAYPICRYYTVFNISQCDGITHKRLTEWEDKQAEAEAETVDANETIEAAENIVSNWENGCAIEHEKTRAYYSPLEDTIGMPNLADFETPPAYYSTLFHEMTHATGHHSRLNRFSETEPVGTFGSASYSKEELAAEMGASFLAAEADIDPALFFG